MHAAKQIIIAVVVIVLSVTLFNVGIAAFVDMNTPHACGYVEYVPIEVLPEGASAVVLTESDFARHPAFRVIFEEENPDYSITMVYDIHRPGNPQPSIGEQEGYWLLYEYPYVEYNGQLYECCMAIA